MNYLKIAALVRREARGLDTLRTASRSWVLAGAPGSGPLHERLIKASDRCYRTNVLMRKALRAKRS